MGDYVTELRISGVWQDISADVQDKQAVTITRGRQDWASEADPATMTLRLNNGESKVMPGQYGRYSRRNPMSDLYGLIGRNTPIRRRRDIARAPRLELPGVDGSYISTPRTALIDLTSDMDVRIEVTLPSWRPAGNDVLLASKYWFTGGNAQRSWSLSVLSDGRLQLRTSPDGTALVTTPSTAAVPSSSTRLAVRATVDVNNGAGGNTVVFYTSSSIDGSWTQLGSTVVNSGATSLFNSSADLVVGSTHGGASFGPGENMAGIVHAFELRAGIGGGVRCRLNPSTGSHEPEDRTLTDTAGRTWTLYEAATYTDATIRFVGEVSVWPPKWDLSAGEQWVPIQAAGISRRVAKGKSVLRSSLFRDLSTKANVAAYWPLEEPEGATSFASGLAGDASVLRPNTLAEIDPAASDVFVASAPVPAFGDVTVSGNVPPYPSPNVAQRLVFLVAIPGAGISTDRHLLRAATTGAAARWDIVYAAGGGLRFRCYDPDLNLIFDHGPWGNSLDGAPHMLSLWLEQQGASCFFQLARFPIGSDTAFVVDEGSVATTFTRFASVTLGTTVGLDGTAIGHLALLNGDVHNIWDTASNSLRAWSGERAADRLIRLATDAGLAAPRVIGAGADTALMGPQLIKSRSDLLGEVPVADLGMVNDRRDALGHAMRTRTSLYNQAPRLLLDYATGIVSDDFTPTDDDQHTRNQVTVERLRGSKVTLRAATGPLSVADPPDGVGPYEYSETVSLATDEQTPDQAGWRLHLGTVDEPRFPNLTLDLLNERVAMLREEILALEEGDLVRITHLPAHIYPDDLDLIVDASTETKSSSVWKLDFTCSPGSAWTVGTWLETTDTPGPADAARYDTAGTIRSVGSGTISATQTAITLTTITGPLWTTSASDLPLDIMVGGERMRVTAIGAHTSNGQQLFTVVRAVNGVRKSHPGGTAVSLFRPSRYAL